MIASQPPRRRSLPAPVRGRTGLRISDRAAALRAAVADRRGGAFVFIEPSPYEVASLLTMVIFVIGGPHAVAGADAARRAAGPPQHRLRISAGPCSTTKRVAAVGLTSWYLALTALFFAAMLGANTEARLDALTRGCMIGGVIAVARRDHRLFPCASRA